ncbi:hypothetical protein SSP24_76610 [Streptomyces spinoverrucosus]|uniref:Uncharacterized protein n=1 Tax=Streptomyces spinoverrucosus TaxID=284043 RepID=A0A4Y3VY92_9ACTN|nr:hypothetical protein SSP24_76610 [Streptomyces spinoverrucosus]GHB75203.1 hypothetical protein GCM10010397_51950 [Streptomyces spinoverrucosus]
MSRITEDLRAATVVDQPLTEAWRGPVGPTPAVTDVPVMETAAPPEPEETDLVEGGPTTEAPAPSVTLDDDVLNPPAPTSRPGDEAARSASEYRANSR